MNFFTQTYVNRSIEFKNNGNFVVLFDKFDHFLKKFWEFFFGISKKKSFSFRKYGAENFISFGFDRFITI